MLAVFGCTNAPARAEGFAKAEIYYYNWDIDLRARMTPADVREKYLSKLEMRDARDIHEFVSRLPVGELRRLNAPMENVDVRLVIDLYSFDGSVKTYYASTFYFFADDGTYAAELGTEFSKEFGVQGRAPRAYRDVFTACPGKIPRVPFVQPQCYRDKVARDAGPYRTGWRICLSSVRCDS